MKEQVKSGAVIVVCGGPDGRRSALSDGELMTRPQAPHTPFHFIPSACPVTVYSYCSSHIVAQAVKQNSAMDACISPLYPPLRKRMCEISATLSLKQPRAPTTLWLAHHSSPIVSVVGLPSLIAAISVISARSEAVVS